MEKVFWPTSIFLSLILTGCVSIDAVSPEQPNVSNAFVDESQVKAGQALVPSDVHWWSLFNDPVLDQWMAVALSQNYSLKAAAARLEQSEASLRSARADYVPNINASLGKERNWIGDDPSVTTSNWTAGVSTQYELDLWGSVAALSQQQALLAEASASSVRTVANTVAGEVTTAWLGIRNQQQVLSLLYMQQERLDEALKVARARYQRGSILLSDVLQQERLLQSISVDIYAAEAQRDVYLQQLAVWTGEGSVRITPEQLENLPSLSPFTEPMGQVALQALQTRPDVITAYYQVQAANAGVAAAISQRYPRFTLSASYSGEDQDINNVFDNWFASLAGALVMPIIDGGQRRANVSRQQAVESEAIANYQQTLLNAAQEVQNALIRERQYQITLDNLGEQLVLARKSLKLQNLYYSSGRLDFLFLLDAQRQLLALENQYLSALWSQTQARIQVYKAVSHGQFNLSEGESAS
ncbi:MAG: TolC family protein [Oleibacter sp.]|nr:TolC family protein [Thalassolituus sp.]